MAASATKLALLDIDTQVDFIHPSGALYVPGADAIIPNLHRLMQHAVDRALTVISSADAHPCDDPSFRQWPLHCVIGTAGALRIPETQLASVQGIANRPGIFHPPLPAATQLILEKVDYDISSNPNFDAVLAALGASRFITFGVATEYCVRASALALRRRGYAVNLVVDAVRGITAQGHQKALRELAAAGVGMTTTNDVLA